MEGTAVDTRSGRAAHLAVGSPPMGVMRRTGREIGLALVTAGVIVLAFVTYQLWGTGFHERYAQSQLKQSFNAAVAHHGTPGGGGSSGSGGHSGGGSRGGHGGSDNPTLGNGRGTLSPSTPTGAAVDHLVIPAIGVNKYVVQGTGAAQLSEGPGHYPNTPFPGQKGNAAIAGHRTTYGAPFFRLNDLKVGNRIYLTDTRGRVFVFKVTKLEVVAPTDVAVLDDTPTATLTLTTCNPPFSATNRLVAKGALIGRPMATPATSTTTVPVAKHKTKAVGAASPVTTTPSPSTTISSSDNLGTGNSSGWPPAIAYGAVVVLLWIGTRIAINRTRGWSRVAAFVVGIAVCAVPLWFTFENAVRLLPANI